MGWPALGRESGCGNTAPPCVVYTPSPTHQHKQRLLPPLPVSHLAAPFRPAVCWELQVLAARFSPDSLHAEYYLPACTALGGSSLCTSGACVRTAHVHTHLLPGDWEAWRPGSLDYFISLRLSQVLTVHRSPLSWLC